MTYVIKKCDDIKNWESYIKKSKQFNLFASKKFLEDKYMDYDLYLLYKNNNFIVGFLINKTNESNKNFLYQNIFYSEYFDNISISKSSKIKIEATEYFLNFLYEKYDQIKLSLHFTIHDIRPFQWLNYHEKKKSKFKILIRYTGLLELDNYNNFDDYISKIRYARRSDYKKALGENYFCLEETNTEIILNLLRKTYERQNISENFTDLLFSQKLISHAITNNYGRLLVCYNEDKIPVSSSFFLHDHNYGYYYIGATNPEFRKYGVGTLVILEQLKYLYNKNIKKYDFVGINSPNRGDFKTSFNANPSIYFELNLIK